MKFIKANEDFTMDEDKLLDIIRRNQPIRNVGDVMKAEGWDENEDIDIPIQKLIKDGKVKYEWGYGYIANESGIETTESEKATEIKEEYSEYAYKEYLNGMLDENGELLVYGRHFRGADDLEENDNPAFREGYNQWLDDIEREGTDTGSYEANTKGVPKGIPSELLEQRHEEEKEKSGVPDNWTLGDGQKVKQWDEDEAQQGESKASESYWGDQGQYQDLYNKYHSEIPDEGSVNDSLLEQLRIVSNVYYDVGNNGGVNMISGMGSAGEHGKINGFIPETIRLVNKVEQADNKGKELKYDEEQRLIQASLQELDGIVDNLLQQIKNDRTDKDEQSNYWGESKASELAPTIEDMKYDDEPMRFGDGRGILGDPLYPESTKKEEEPKLDTEEEIDNYIKNANEDATGSDIGSDYLNKQLMELPYDEQQDRLRTARDEQSPLDNIYHSDRVADRIASGNAPTYAQSGVSDFDNFPINKDRTKLDTVEGIDEFIKKEADEIIGALAVNDELEGIKDTYGSSPNADPTTTPLEDHSGTDDSSDTQTDISDAQQETSDVVEDTVEESFGDCGCKDTKKARMTWESAIEGDKQYWLRNMGEDEGYSYYHFEHLPKRVGESLVNKFKVEESEDRGWSKIPALERANLLKKLGFPPRDAELVANLEYPQLSESLKKDVNDAVGVKKKAEESKREKPDGQLAFENDLYSNMYDGYLQRRGERVDSKKNNKF